MAKEQQLSVVFVYDCESCVSEADDPQDAVLYFHPAWVSEQQKLALCGQLMGASHFFLASFSCPRMIALRSGQFAIRQCGRFILAVGADHSFLPWVLQKRADSLLGLVRLFHGGLEGLALSCDHDRTVLVDKLQVILDTFVPIAQNFGDTFGHEPTLFLPKSASNAFIEAVQVLEFCQEQPGVLGGMVLYNNRVVATQLSPDLTRRFIYSNPLNIKSCVESVPTPYEMPLGSRLLRVFLEKTEFHNLNLAAIACRDAFLNITQSRPDKGGRQFGSMMKKDVSRIFTVMEEKEPFDDFDGGTVSPVTAPTPPLPFHMRKSSIPLEGRFTPPLTARMSLPAGAVTPGTLGKILHDKRLSICTQNEDEEDTREQEEPEPSLFKHSPVQEEKKLEDKPAVPPNFPLQSTFQPSKQQSRSLEDLRPTVTNRGYCGPLPIRGYSFGLPKLNQDDFSPKEKIEPKTGGLQRLFNTITDPSFPVFRGDGLPVSQELFNKYLEQHYCELNAEGRAQKIKPKSPEKIVSSSVIPKKLERPVSLLPEVSKESGSGRQELYRRSLSLPLKSIVVNGGEDEDEVDVLNRRKSFVPEHGRLQEMEMTPLSSILSFSERTGTPGEVPGFPRAATTPGARVTTPAEFRSFLAESRKKELANGDSLLEDTGKNQEDMSKAVLYVHGYQGMTLVLVLEHQEEADWDLTETLGEAWLGASPQLEGHLRRSLEQTAAGSADQREPYSFLCLDPAWDALQKDLGCCVR
ncbi:hypothetical protein B566_EDAN010359 [Ephemera danica]|nr:hypothetical protein B566_EDAN010359 [Ephemera danica]